MTDYSCYDNEIGKLQPGKVIVYDGQYRVADDETDKKLKKLEGDIDFLRGMLIDIYSKCPKMTHDFNGDKKKRKKNDAVECENCGGLLW